MENENIKMAKRIAFVAGVAGAICLAVYAASFWLDFNNRVLWLATVAGCCFVGTMTGQIVKR